MEHMECTKGRVHLARLAEHGQLVTVGKDTAREGVSKFLIGVDRGLEVCELHSSISFLVVLFAMPVLY